MLMRRSWVAFDPALCDDGTLCDDSGLCGDSSLFVVHLWITNRRLRPIYLRAHQRQSYEEAGVRGSSILATGRAPW